jgi:uncharacterized protein (TIGR03435 family)
MTEALPQTIWSMVELLGDHLWQSTLVAIVIGMLTLVLRQNHAEVRYRLWLAASLKFLVPFGMLTAIGRQFDWQSAAPIVTPNVMVAIEAVSQPFSQPASSAARDAAVSITVPGVPILPVALLFIWLCGLTAIVLHWFMQWRHITLLVRRASPVGEGPEVATLRRVEKMSGITRPVNLVVSDTSIEPGIFGIFRPVLLWPRGMSEHLDEAQVAAVMVHELAHVRRRDNLVAAVHSITQAVFWFHPLVWWVGTRLMDERERSCDQDVIRLGSEPQVYAESILKTCRFSVVGSAAWVSGVSGSDLKRRIEAIMCRETVRALNGWRKVLLLSVVITTVGAPLVAGIVSAPRLDAQSSPTPGTSPAFEIASVRENRSPEGFVQLGIEPGGRFMARNMPLRMLIRTAYQLQDAQLIGGPEWVSTNRFDVLAKGEGNVPLNFPGPGAPAGPLQLMLQSLLAERFSLRVHRERSELPIYAVLLARNDGKLGPQLRRTAVDCMATAAAGGRDTRSLAPAPGEHPHCGTRFVPGRITGGGLLMSQFAMSLSQSVQRIVVDRTGLTGYFDIDLKWTPQLMSQGGTPPGALPLPPVDPSGPSIFTAVQEQLGLKLEPTKSSVDVLVIDHVEPPTPD